MNIEDVGRVMLALEALACAWMGVLAWREAADDRLALRIVGPLLGFTAATLIVYGLID